MIALAGRDRPSLHGSWDQATHDDGSLTAALASWLPDQRWFAGKQHRITAVTIETVVPLPPVGTPTALLVVRVAFDAVGDHRYAVPLTTVDGATADAIVAARPAALVAMLDGGVVVDAMAVPEAAAAIARAALTPVRLTGRGGAARGCPRRPGLAAIVAEAGAVSPLVVEQSNSSMLIGSSLIAKLVRRVVAGPNPDAVLPGHLSARGFTHVPGLAATLEVDVLGESVPADVVIVHDLVRHDGDLWERVLAELAVAIEGNADLAGLPSATALPALLGRRTAEMHRVLATSDHTTPHALRPVPFSLTWQRALVRTLRRELLETQRALRTSIRPIDPSTPLLQPAERILERFARLRSTPLTAIRTRVHGDLHLGQILAAGDDVVFIDFEGEPGRPIAERAAKRSPLSDVAGLLRSFDYAGRSAVDTAIERGVVTQFDRGTLDTDRARWTAQASRALTEAYLSTVAGAGIVPDDAADAELLLAAFLLQKGLYEIRYELASRPDWVAWPLAAVTEMIAA